MALNLNQFVTVTPEQERSGIPHKDWKPNGIISAADALQLVTPEMPRSFTTGDYRRTDWSAIESGETSLRDFVPYRHAPRLYQVKSERARWGEPDSMYRHIQKHGLDSSNAIYVMKNPLNTNQVLLTEGHHRVAAAHAVDPDMPIHFIDEGAHMNLNSVMDRAQTYSDNLDKTEGYLAEYLKNPESINANIRPSNPGTYHWRDMGWHQS